MERHLIVPEKPVKPRRSHFKSRNGCLHCKQRRVKCDEQHPICGPCAKRQLPCGFKNQQDCLSPSSHPLRSPRHSVSHPNQLSCVPDSTEVVGQSLYSSTRILELKLLLHFSTSTYHSIAISSLDHSFMQVHVPELALSHPYLMDSIFALSALHLEHLDHRRAKDWLRIALSYQNRALAEFTRVLQTINQQNCRAVAICSMLTKIATLAIPSVSGETRYSDLLSEFLTSQSLSVGVKNILDDFEADLRIGPMKEWFATVYESKSERAARLQQIDDPEDSDFSPEQVLIYNALLHSLDELFSYIQSEQTPNQELYLHYCRTLRESLKPLSRCVLIIASISWPLEITIEKLRSMGSDIILRMILIHYGVVLHLNHERWFAHGAGQRLLRSLLPDSLDIPSNKLRGMIKWARDVVGV